MIANHNHRRCSPTQTDIDPIRISEGADLPFTIRPDCRQKDIVLLSSLEAVDSVDV